MNHKWHKWKWFVRFSSELSQTASAPSLSVPVTRRHLGNISSLLWGNVKGSLGEIAALGNRTGFSLQGTWGNGALSGARGSVLPSMLALSSYRPSGSLIGIYGQFRTVVSFQRGNLKAFLRKLQLERAELLPQCRALEAIGSSEDQFWLLPVFSSVNVTKAILFSGTQSAIGSTWQVQSFNSRKKGWRQWKQLGGGRQTGSLR